MFVMVVCGFLFADPDEMDAYDKQVEIELIQK